MLTLVFRAVDYERLEAVMLSISPWMAVAVVAGYLVGQFLSALKWWMIAKQAGIDATYRVTLKSYFIGMFVNCFGFGVVGGDVARGLMLSQGKPQKTPAIASVLADRLHGLAILCLLASVSALYFGSRSLNDSLSILLILVSVSIVVGWFIGPAILLKIIPETSKYRRKVVQLCQVFPTNPRALIPITVVSLAFHFSQLWLHWLMGHGLGVDLSWQIILTAIPIVNILATLPISWNGLGVREKSYEYFLVPAYLAPEHAIAFGAIWLLAVTVSSAVGGIVAVLTKDFEVVSKMQASDEQIPASLEEVK